MTMSQSGKLTPNLDQQCTKALNLTVLQRIDPFVMEILMTAAHVTLYEFDVDKNQWSRKDVEGTLFVVKRNAQPRFQFIVMNRRNTENLVENILGDFEYEVQVPYILYRNAAQEVNGIWFYNSYECEAISNLLSRILNAYAKVLPKPKVSSNKSEFQELEAAPSPEMIEGPLETPVLSAADAVTDTPDEPLASLISAAMNENMSNFGSIGQIPLTTPSITLSSHAPSIIPSANATISSATALLTSSTVIMPTLDTCGSTSENGHATNLVKPLYLLSTPISSALAMPPISSIIPATCPLPPVTMQKPIGTPLLQPFPPPLPPSSLNPVPVYEPVISRDKVRDVMLRLVQNNDFVDMVYRELLNAHYT
ncbi:mRNA-decapping enzyme-like protein [Canna indica]|uniref:mRNA-decapping enzyme-like protein n=1 Tax=Canna indica TaxID=4628 RepID=A0AAQ3L0J9_9LILI|nr:mRNA-decapping enzyme-like protein [Canna indica]